MTTGKKGPWSKEDRLFIRQNYDKMDHTAIAKQLKRDPNAIFKYMEQEGLLRANNSLEPKKYLDIRDTRHWPILVSQFSEEELDLCVYHWNSMLEQFNEDVTHTEEVQIIDVIKVEILSNRILTAEKKQQQQIEEMQKIINSERKQPIELRNHDYILNLEKQVANLFAAIDVISKEYRDLIRQKMAMLDKLKATRDHRQSLMEDSHESIVGWFRQLMERPELRKQIGLSMEKMRIAVQEEYHRLSEYHTYADGSIDQPILCAETLKEDHQ